MDLFGFVQPVALVEVLGDGRDHGEDESGDEDVEDAGHGGQSQRIGVVRVGRRERAPTLALVYPPRRLHPLQRPVFLVLQDAQRNVFTG